MITPDAMAHDMDTSGPGYTAATSSLQRRTEVVTTMQTRPSSPTGPTNMGLGRRAIVVLGLALIALALTAGVLVFYSGQPSSPGSLGTVGEIPNRIVPAPDRDVPCVENADGSQTCATPLPGLSAADRALSTPLEVSGLSIPLDHLGAYRMFVGQATLPRGEIEVMALSLSNSDSGTYFAPSFSLQLEDAMTKRPLPLNIYEKGVVDGAQTVNVYLRFDLTSFKVGATVEVKHIEVR